MEINFKNVVMVIAGIAAFLVIYSFYASTELNERPITLEVTMVTQSYDYNDPSWSDYVVPAVRNKNIKETEEFTDVSGLKIFKREFIDDARKPHGTILYLHGMKYTSHLWSEIAALLVTADLGYRAVAIDMPGFGKSDSHIFNDPSEKVSFMLKLLDALDMTGETKPIIVCPSMSGTYAMPLLFQHPEVFQGFVPVAPAVDYDDKLFQECQVPTCSIVGLNDTAMGTAATKKFILMPNVEAYTIHDAGHMCFDSAVMTFHEILYAFANKVYNIS